MLESEHSFVSISYDFYGEKLAAADHNGHVRVYDKQLKEIGSFLA